MHASIADIEIGFLDFIELFSKNDDLREDPQGQTYIDWYDDMRVYRHGIYLTEPKGATAKELLNLPAPPNGDYSQPALPLPCTLAELQAFLDRYDLIGIPDAFVLADWLAKKRAVQDQPRAHNWAYSHDTTLLKAVRWVIETYGQNPQWPTKELVIDKLTSLQGLGVNEAKAVDAVTRPDILRNRHTG